MVENEMKEEIKGSVERVKFPDKESFQKLKLKFKKVIIESHWISE